MILGTVILVTIFSFLALVNGIMIFKYFSKALGIIFIVCGFLLLVPLNEDLSNIVFNAIDSFWMTEVW